ncbi:hypothetical protein BO71DRAFT_327953, partial [Aspergillus ellipticus CBS 707.79]
PPAKRKSTDMAATSAPGDGPNKENSEYIVTFSTAASSTAGSGAGGAGVTCDAIRREIRAFVASGAMTAGEFQKAIGVSARSYTEFLNQEGSEKRGRSATFVKARVFFCGEGGQGFGGGAASVIAAAAPAPAAKRAKKNTTAPAGPHFDVAGVHLDGEENMQVKIFDTCDVVRRKIKAHLRKQGVTQAGFLRQIAAAAIPEAGKKLNSKSLADFLSYKGPTAGSAGIIFYAAYVFFEKLRVRDGKPKNEFRHEMERIWPGGFERDNPGNSALWCGPGERPFTDKYGQLEFHQVYPR